MRERESLNGLYGPMSVVVTNTVKQLQVNVRPHRYNICSDKTVLRTSKALCREVASKREREREAGERERERERDHRC